VACTTNRNWFQFCFKIWGVDGEKGQFLFAEVCYNCDPLLTCHLVWTSQGTCCCSRESCNTRWFQLLIRCCAGHQETASTARVRSRGKAVLNFICVWSPCETVFHFTCAHSLAVVVHVFLHQPVVAKDSKNFGDWWSSVFCRPDASWHRVSSIEALNAVPSSYCYCSLEWTLVMVRCTLRYVLACVVMMEYLCPFTYEPVRLHVQNLEKNYRDFQFRVTHLDPVLEPEVHQREKASTTGQIRKELTSSRGNLSCC